MNSATQSQKAQQFRALHEGPGMLVLPNAWDVSGARWIEEAGFPAIATSSAGVAWALGWPDGERISRGEMLAVVRRIALSVRIPVTADVEAGYGRTPEAAAETARGVIAAGAIGLNLEDGTNEASLLDLALQVERIRAVRQAGAAARVPLVVNARTDAFEVKQWAPAERFAAAVRRANAYHAAGADCLFVPHVSDAATIGQLAREIDGPLNVIAGPPAPPLSELERLGVRRASRGPRGVQATLRLIRRIAVGRRHRGTFATLPHLCSPMWDGGRRTWAPPREPASGPWRAQYACDGWLVQPAAVERSAETLAHALQALARVAHRAAAATDNSGDGAGLLTQIPSQLFYRDAASRGLPLEADQPFAVGVFFLPTEHAALGRAIAIIDAVLREGGLPILGWRDVPIDAAVLGDSARATCPTIRQAIIAAPA